MAFDRTLASATPPLRVHVDHVLGLRSGPEVVGVHAVPHVAGVAYQHPVRDRAVVKRVGQPVGQPYRTAKVPVPRSGLRSGPQPAGVGLLDTTHEALHEGSAVRDVAVHRREKILPAPPAGVVRDAQSVGVVLPVAPGDGAGGGC